MMFDTDVLIWLIRGSRAAGEQIAGATELSLSIVSYMELVEGAHDKGELDDIKEFLARRRFRMLPLSENIGNRASMYMEEFRLKFGLDMGDALIAATAAENHLTLCTANRRHFAAIPGLQLQVIRP
jgi:predicted nucleic acid-binding protein